MNNAVTASAHASGSANEGNTTSKWSDLSFSPQISSRKQAAMLRFRYQLIPWMDANNCKSTFGPEIMHMAHSQGVITDCILYWMEQRNGQPGVETAARGTCTIRQGIQDRLLLEDTFTADVGRSFLATVDVFNWPPSYLTTLPSFYPEESLQKQNFEEAVEPLKTLLRLQVKIGEPSCHRLETKPLLIEGLIRSCRLYCYQQASIYKLTSATSLSHSQSCYVGFQDL
jgi:hypothetical protein